MVLSSSINPLLVHKQVTSLGMSTQARQARRYRKMACRNRVYVHDGEAFYRKLRFHDVVEALIERDVIQPVETGHDRTRESHRRILVQ